MCRPQKEPLRLLSAEEWDQLERFSRSLTMPADQVIHAKGVLAVADGHPFTEAASVFGSVIGSFQNLIPVAKSIFTLAIQRIQAHSEHHF